MKCQDRLIDSLSFIKIWMNGWMDGGRWALGDGGAWRSYHQSFLHDLLLIPIRSALHLAHDGNG